MFTDRPLRASASFFLALRFFAVNLLTGYSTQRYSQRYAVENGILNANQFQGALKQAEEFVMTSYRATQMDAKKKNTEAEEQPRAPAKRRSWRGRAVLVLVGFVLGFLVAEVMLRIVGYGFPTFYQPDAQTGYALKPGAEGTYSIETKSYVRINSDGLHDREHSKAKPPNTFRIAIVGDSYSEALQVPLEKAYWHLLEPKLKECAHLGKEIEAINFGVSGYGTAQELLTLRERVWAYQPDFVVLQMTTNNDITDNLRAFKKADYIPYFTIRNGELWADNSFLDSGHYRRQQSFWGRSGRWIEDHSRVIQGIHQALYSIRIRLAARREERTRKERAGEAAPATGAPPTNHAPEDVGIDNLIYAEPHDPNWIDAWNITELLIRQMNREVKEHNAQLVVVTASNAVQVFPNAAARAAFLQRAGATDIFYPDLRIKTFCERESIPVITLAPRLQAYADQHQAYLHGFEKLPGSGHWNELGHEVVAEIIAEDLCRKMVLPISGQ